MPIEAWQHYFAVVKDALADVTGVVLKTDAYNEVLALPGPGGIVAAIPETCRVEIIDNDKALFGDAKKRFHNHRVHVRYMDIRLLTWPNATFDAAIDCSTIDHVMEYKQVLTEYARVLKPHGKLVLFCWVTPGPTVTYDIGAFEQMFLHEAGVREELARHFDGSYLNIPNSGQWAKYPCGRSMLQFVGTKR